MTRFLKIYLLFYRRLHTKKNATNMNLFTEQLLIFLSMRFTLFQSINSRVNANSVLHFKYSLQYRTRIPICCVSLFQLYSPSISIINFTYLLHESRFRRIYFSHRTCSAEGYELPRYSLNSALRLAAHK